MSLPRPKDISDAVLVTHRTCLDGAGCAIVFLRAGGRRENIRFVPAGMLENFVKKDPVFAGDEFIIFADIGLNVPKYATRIDKRGNCVLLDHHKTSAHLADRPWAGVDMDACGTELLRRYLGDDIGPEHTVTCETLARVIDDHDRWLCEVPEAMDLAMFMVFVGQHDFVERFSGDRQVPDVGSLFTATERDLITTLRRRRDEAICEAIDRCRVRDVRFADRSLRIAYVVNDEPNTSLLLNRLLDERPDVQVATQVMVGTGKVSMRSRGDVDVTEIARQFGGGGHVCAAGHVIPTSVIDGLIDKVHNA